MNYATKGKIKVLETKEFIVYLCTNKDDRFNGQSEIVYKEKTQ